MLASIAETVRLGLKSFNFRPYCTGMALLSFSALTIERIVQRKFKINSLEQDDFPFMLLAAKSIQVLGLHAAFITDDDLSANKLFIQEAGWLFVLSRIYQSYFEPRTSSNYYLHLLGIGLSHTANIIAKIANSVIIGRFIGYICREPKNVGTIKVVSTITLGILSAINAKWDWNNLSILREDAR